MKGGAPSPTLARHEFKTGRPPGDRDLKLFYAADEDGNGEISAEEFEVYKLQVAVRFSAASDASGLMLQPCGLCVLCVSRCPCALTLCFDTVLAIRTGCLVHAWQHVKAVVNGSKLYSAY